jgi:hypothetical protein
MIVLVGQSLGFVRCLLMLMMISVGMSPGRAGSAPHRDGYTHAHAHGQASAQVSLEGAVLRLEIQGAMDNFLSFEHPPKTNAQRAELQQLQEALKDAHWLAVPAVAAQCRSTGIRSKSALFDQTAGGKGHADLVVSLTFECSNPAALNAIRFSALDQGRRMKKLAVEFVGPSGQRAVTLTQARPILELK